MRLGDLRYNNKLRGDTADTRAYTIFPRLSVWVRSSDIILNVLVVEITLLH